METNEGVVSLCRGRKKIFAWETNGKASVVLPGFFSSWKRERERVCLTKGSNLQVFFPRRRSHKFPFVYLGKFSLVSLQRGRNGFSPKKILFCLWKGFSHIQLRDWFLIKWVEEEIGGEKIHHLSTLSDDRFQYVPLNMGKLIEAPFFSQLEIRPGATFSKSLLE